MPSQRNVDQLSALKEKFAKAKSVVFVDHSGMPVAKQQELHAHIKGAGGEISVAKNTLLSLALGQKQEARSSKHEVQTMSHEPRATSPLQGPTSVLFSYQDEILPLKVLATFIKDNEKPVIKSGFLGNRALTASEVTELAKLPGMQELIVQLMGRLQSPAYGLVTVLAGNARKLVCVLDARKNMLIR